MTVAASPAEKHNGKSAPADRPLAQLSSEIADMDTEIRRFVHERPLLALGAAVAVGYIVGRVFSKL